MEGYCSYCTNLPMHIQWVLLNIIPSVHSLSMILSGIFHYPGSYICGIRTMYVHNLPRTDLQCASGRVYSCEQLAEASTSTCLSTQSVTAKLISHECAELSCGCICCLPAARGAWQYYDHDIMPISNPSFMTIMI